MFVDKNTVAKKVNVGRGTKAAAVFVLCHRCCLTIKLTFHPFGYLSFAQRRAQGV